MIKIILKPRRDESLRRFHPWVFSGAIAQIQGNPAEGDLVSVYSAEGDQLAIGHYQIGSIAVRVLSFNGDPTDPEYWNNAIARALDARIAVGLYNPFFEGCDRREPGDVTGVEPPSKAMETTTSCFRLVHGEGDGLPGLIIDWYDGVCVMQAHSVGMFRAKKQICEALRTVFGDRLKAVYDKSSGTAPFKAGLELIDGYLWKSEGFDAPQLAVLENGNKFLVNWVEGQKTGFFLDQRDNRALVGKYAAGRNVLNLFCYTGGFSIYAMNNGAEHVDSVDSSAKAMALVQKNMELNGADPARYTNYCDDAIEFLGRTEAGKYDLMIVDPPAFAKHRGALKNALRAYQRLNAAAISKVASGGLVFTFSCSQVVDKITFAEVVFSAAAQTGRSVRIIDRLCQGSDHPVSIYHPEGEYLKGLLLYVE
ncbi:MAG: class I SAM-dependent rRNA methyltransferase [Bacteroidales bacterium]|nr:class I SAM-dependent rRNA methyltransferase [Bacteroidales bacterium]